MVAAATQAAPGNVVFTRLGMVLSGIDVTGFGTWMPLRDGRAPYAGRRRAASVEQRQGPSAVSGARNTPSGRV